MNYKSLLIALFLIVGQSVLLASVPWQGSAEIWTKGSGTESDPYLIETPEHLAYLSGNLSTYRNQYFLQTADIDLNAQNAYTWRPIGSYSTYNKNAFTGFYDGGNYQISNVSNCVFGYVSFATIKNVVVTGQSNSPLIEIANSATITNCQNKSTVDVKFAGVVKQVTGTTTLAECGNYATISTPYEESGNNGWFSYTRYYAGGCFAKIDGESTIKRCFNSGSITITSECNNAYVGGIIGMIIGNNDTTNNVIECCCNIGKIKVNTTNKSNVRSSGSVGGLVGNNNKGSLKITHSYSTGNISANMPYTSTDSSLCVGGIIGEGKYKCMINGCYVTGKIAETIGMCQAMGNHLEYVQNSFCIVGSENKYATILSTIEMQSSSFIQFLNAEGDYFCLDYTNINNGYPILRWQLGDTPFYTIKGICKSEQGTVSGAGEYPQGAQVKLTATPKDNYTFIGWSDGNTDNPRTISVDTLDATYVAQFDRLSYTVYVNQDCSITVE